MLLAKKIKWWRNRYEITADGQLVSTWDKSAWKTGGAFDLDGRRYEVRGNLWGSRYEMVAQEDGTVVAAAHRVGRKRWTVEAHGQVYEFQRASIWRYEEELRSEGRPVGSVRRISLWRSDTVADLPGLPLPVQIFVLTVVLMKWESQASAAPSGS